MSILADLLKFPRQWFFRKKSSLCVVYCSDEPLQNISSHQALVHITSPDPWGKCHTTNKTSKDLGSQGSVLGSTKSGCFHNMLKEMRRNENFQGLKMNTG
jgi:hypothetical protein